MLNTVGLKGRFTNGPDFKKTIKGTSLVDFNLAIERIDGKAMYVSCVAWDELAELIDRNFKKGDNCVIQGELNSRLVSAKDSAGRTQRYTKLEVVVKEICKEKDEDCEDDEAYEFEYNEDWVPGYFVPLFDEDDDLTADWNRKKTNQGRIYACDSLHFHWLL